MQRGFGSITFPSFRCTAFALACALLAPAMSEAAIASATIRDVTSNAASDKGECTFVEPPTNPTELIKNIQCAVTKNIFSEDDIFTNDEKLWKLFGGDAFFKPYFRTFHTLPNYRVLSVMHFDNTIDHPIDDQTCWRDRLSIDLYREISPPQQLDVGQQIRLDITNARRLQVSFDGIVNLFGPNWQPVNDYKVFSTTSQIASSDMKARNANNVHSSKLFLTEISYTLPTPKSEKAIVTLHFGNDKILDTFNLTILE